MGVAIGIAFVFACFVAVGFTGCYTTSRRELATGTADELATTILSKPITDTELSGPLQRANCLDDNELTKASETNELTKAIIPLRKRPLKEQQFSKLTKSQYEKVGYKCVGEKFYVWRRVLRHLSDMYLFFNFETKTLRICSKEKEYYTLSQEVCMESYETCELSHTDHHMWLGGKYAPWGEYARLSSGNSSTG